MKIGVLTSHPIQYQAPIFRALAEKTDLQVYFAHRASPADQAREGFGEEFEWDTDLETGYCNEFLDNVSSKPSVSRFSGCDAPTIKRKIEDGRFDGFVVMGWQLKAYWQAIRACRRSKTKVVVRGDSHLETSRSTYIKILKKPLYTYMLNCFDAYLYVGQRNRAYLEHYGARADKLFFSPHSVDVGWFAEQASAARLKRDELRRSLGIRVQSRVLMFVGKLQKIKRPQDLIGAAEILDAKGCPVDIIFVGTGDLEANLKHRAADAGFPVCFLGFVNQSKMPQTYVLADVLVLPSESETWGLVVNEAMSCGIRAIVSDSVGCAPDLIEPGETGYQYPVGNIPALADVLEKTLFSSDEDLAAKEFLSRKMKAFSPDASSDGIVASLTPGAQR